MTDRKKKTNAPSLGGKRRAKKSGLEPGLSRYHHPQRTVTFGGLMELLHTPYVHSRFRAVLALADFADHDGAVAALIRSLGDDSVLVRLAAIFALGQIGPRISNPMLSEQATVLLAAFLDRESKLIIPSVAIRVLLGLPQSGPESSASLAFDERLTGLSAEGQTPIVHLSEFAAEALQKIGTLEAAAALDAWREHPRQ